jgi:hypothetical protein
MANRDKDLSDPYVKWYYRNEEQKARVRKVILIAVGVLIAGAAVYCFVAEHEALAAIIGAFLIVALGIAIFWNECRGNDLPWKTIIPFTVALILFFVVCFIIASR